MKGENNVGMYILIFVIGAALGVIGGFFGARQYMKKYLQDNPPISEDMMRTMMMQIGQKPSEKKLNQMMASMKAQSRKAGK